MHIAGDVLQGGLRSAAAPQVGYAGARNGKGFWLRGRGDYVAAAPRQDEYERKGCERLMGAGKEGCGHLVHGRAPAVVVVVPPTPLLLLLLLLLGGLCRNGGGKPDECQRPAPFLDRDLRYTVLAAARYKCWVLCGTTGAVHRSRPAAECGPGSLGGFCRWDLGPNLTSSFFPQSGPGLGARSLARLLAGTPRTIDGYSLRVGFCRGNLSERDHGGTEEKIIQRGGSWRGETITSECSSASPCPLRAAAAADGGLASMSLVADPEMPPPLPTAM